MIAASPPLLTPARHAIGVITPSGNTVVERVTIGILRDFPEVACHFSRTGVTGSVDPFPQCYDWESMLGAARLLAHAAPDIVTWSGSKAGSIAFELDRELVRRIGDAATRSDSFNWGVVKEFFNRRHALVIPRFNSHGATSLFNA